MSRDNVYVNVLVMRYASSPFFVVGLGESFEVLCPTSALVTVIVACGHHQPADSPFCACDLPAIFRFGFPCSLTAVCVVQALGSVGSREAGGSPSYGQNGGVYIVYK